MIRRCLAWLFGAYRVEIPLSDVSRASDALYRRRIRCLYQKSGVFSGGDGDDRKTVVFWFRKRDRAEVGRIFCGASAVPLREDETGLPRLLYRYRHRPGLLLGMVLLLAAVFVSQFFLWEIRISDTGGVPEAEVRELLASFGIYEGAFRPSLDLSRLYNEILLQNDDFCWLSVNIRGSVADVELRPFQKPQKGTMPKGKCANLVAACDGEIELIEAHAGQTVVAIGQPVREGQLLVSGIYEDKTGRTVVCYANGKVYAKVRRELEVSVPLLYEKRVQTGVSVSDLTIKFFHKSVKVFNNSRNIEKEYGIIEKEQCFSCVTVNEQLDLFGIRLPLWVRLDKYSAFRTEDARRSEDAAYRIAEKQLAERLLSLIGDGSILSIEKETSFSGESYDIRCTVYVSTDIAKIQEFGYEDG